MIVDGNEINGLGVDGHLNVVKTTLEEREFKKELKDYIIIQNEGTGILILIGKDDKIYTSDFKKIAESFNEYLLNEVL